MAWLGLRGGEGRGGGQRRLCAAAATPPPLFHPLRSTVLRTQGTEDIPHQATNTVGTQKPNWRGTASSSIPCGMGCLHECPSRKLAGPRTVGRMSGKAGQRTWRLPPAWPGVPARVPVAHLPVFIILIATMRALPIVGGALAPGTLPTKLEVVVATTTRVASFFLGGGGIQSLFFFLFFFRIPFAQQFFSASKSSKMAF